MVIEGPTCAVAVWRAGVLPESPVYQNTVLAAVPLTSDVAVLNGGPFTRCGGFELKKLLAAATAEAAGSAVCARLPTAVVSAACKLPAVAAGVAPMANWFGPGDAAAVAWSVMVWLVPSGRVKLNWTESPLLGFAPSVTVSVLGDPDGCVTVAPVRLELTPASLNPNSEPATSSLIENVDPPPPGTPRRPA